MIISKKSKSRNGDNMMVSWVFGHLILLVIALGVASYLEVSLFVGYPL